MYARIPSTSFFRPNGGASRPALPAHTPAQTSTPRERDTISPHSPPIRARLGLAVEESVERKSRGRTGLAVLYFIHALHINCFIMIAAYPTVKSQPCTATLFDAVLAGSATITYDTAGLRVTLSLAHTGFPAGTSRRISPGLFLQLRETHTGSAVSGSGTPTKTSTICIARALFRPASVEATVGGDHRS